MDTKFIHVVLDSVTHVFSLLVNIGVDLGLVQVKDKGVDVLPNTISGHMNLHSNNASAAITMTFPEAVIVNIANHVMPEEVSGLNEVVIDLVGEITNMVSGGVKGTMESEGYLFELSLPVIILGDTHLKSSLQQGPIALLELDTEFGRFVLETSFKGEPDFSPLPLDDLDSFDDILF